MLCFQCEKELNRKIVSQKKVEQKKLNRKKIKQKKTVLYRSKKKSHRCVAMGINANESSNVGANMVTPCLDRQQFQRCYLAIEKHVSMKKAILSKQHDQNEIFITNVKFVNQTNVMAWSVEVASGILRENHGNQQTVNFIQIDWNVDRCDQYVFFIFPTNKPFYCIAFVC